MAEIDFALGISPSEFMKKLRPGEFSDTRGAPAYKLDQPVLEHWLATLTARNQTHDFEIFCRKLCERSICPNLRPATGPEGGGDGKADSETLPVSEQIAGLTYIGTPKAGEERWAFAFSAMATWKVKARSDIEGIAATGRGYEKVFFVTSQPARARDRSALEDELSKASGSQVVILDRGWIVKRIIEDGQIDLAVDYLKVGERLQHHRPGPSDYTRTLQLEDLEKDIQDPAAYAGMKTQRVTDAILAATLSRELERPRMETDGRFERAIRLADKHGFGRQKLQARYDHLWTTYFWFDDIDQLNERYDSFADSVLTSASARDVEWVSNLTANLVSAVVHGHCTAEVVKLDARRARLTARLKEIAADKGLPNNALEAKTLLLLNEFRDIALGQSPPYHLEALWPQFEDVLTTAEGLIEFDADRLIAVIKMLGQHAGNSERYAELVDQLADFVSRRRGEGESGRILLDRAGQLDTEEDRLEIIRILGKAARQLAKKEHAGALAEATYLLTVAYRGAGMLWAARAQALFCLSSIVADADATSNMSVSIAPALMLLGWIDAELGLLPEWLEALQLLRGCGAVLPFDEASKTRIQDRLDYFDLTLACRILNLEGDALAELSFLPQVLTGLGLDRARTGLLYALGYTEEAFGPPAPSAPNDAEIHDLMCQLAGQPAGDGAVLITNDEPDPRLKTRIVGMVVDVCFPRTEASQIVAETVLAVLETFFATALGAHIAAFTEHFDIRIVEEAGTKPVAEFDESRMRATLIWPQGVLPNDQAVIDEAHTALIVLAGGIMAKACAGQHVPDHVRTLFEDEALGERISTALAAPNSRHRVFHDFVPRLSKWRDVAQHDYKIRPERPRIIRRPPSTGPDEPVPRLEPGFTDQRRMRVRSILDIPLWDRSDWAGLLFAFMPGDPAPIIGLQFTNREAGRLIFEGWRERVGGRDTHDEIHLVIIRQLPDRPISHYGALLTSNLRDVPEGEVVVVPSRLKILEPATDTNLRNFLETYAKVGVYWLVPAYVGPDGRPEILTKLRILKQNLKVLNYDAITDQEPEFIAKQLFLQWAQGQSTVSGSRQQRRAAARRERRQDRSPDGGRRAR